MNIEQYFACISDNPLIEAFERQEKKRPPSVDKAKMLMMPPTWDGGTFEEFAAETYLVNKNKPLSLYIHVPFCHHRCSFCPFYINQTHPIFSPLYAELLSKEISDTARVLKNVIKERSVGAVYFGGGTPSDMEAQDLAAIIRQLYDTFQMAPDVEVTVEGRLRGFTPEKAHSWVEAGANRFSIGVQTTDETLRKRLSRQSSRIEMAKVLNDLHATGATVAVDIMYALPGQTSEMLVDDIRFLSEETKIHGLDLYELRVFPDSRLDKAISRGAMPTTPDFINQAQMYSAAYHKLIEYGYEHFSEKHWRRSPLERSVYNTMAKYQADMVPFGSGGGGRLDNIGLGNNGNYMEYEEAVRAGIKPLKRIMHSPRKHAPDSFAHELDCSLEQLKVPAAQRWPTHFQDQVQILLAQWTKAGLLEAKNDDNASLLTCAGVFWSQRIRNMLFSFLNNAELEAVQSPH